MDLPSLFGAADAHTLELPTGDRAVVAAHGGQLLRWQVEPDHDLLYLSATAETDPGAGRAIRGGVPVCWPQFGERGPLARDGFARLLRWRLHGRDDSSLLMELTHEDLPDDWRAAWPHAFQLRQKIDLAPGQLTLTLDVTNTDAAPWAFSAALGSHLAVGDLAQTRLDGLDLPGARMRALAAPPEPDGAGLPAQTPLLGGAIERVYSAPPLDDDEASLERQLTLRTPARRLTLRQSDSLPEVVLCNPGPRAALPGLADGEWARFLCIAAAALAPVTLQPGEQWLGWQKITLER